MRFDLLGRIVRRIDYVGGSAVQSDSAWIYDTATHGIGQLHMEDTQVGGSTPIRRTYAYDSYGRPSGVTTEIVRGSETETYTDTGRTGAATAGCVERHPKIELTRHPDLRV